MTTRVGMINFSLNMLDHHVALARGRYRDQGLDVELVAPEGHRATGLLASGICAFRGSGLPRSWYVSITASRASLTFTNASSSVSPSVTRFC